MARAIAFPMGIRSSGNRRKITFDSLGPPERRISILCRMAVPNLFGSLSVDRVRMNFCGRIEIQAVAIKPAPAAASISHLIGR